MSLVHHRPWRILLCLPIRSGISISIIAWIASAVVSCGGSHPRAGLITRPVTPNSLDKIRFISSLLTTVSATSRMEYWLNDERIKPTVLFMGKFGSKLRINALSPVGDDVAADFACDGTTFQYVDFDRNCQLVGQCDEAAINRLLRIRLKPDDFMRFAIGSTPIVDNPTGTISWNGNTQQETLNLVSGDRTWTQTIVVTGHENHWDLLSSTLRDRAGNIEWKITNKDFVNDKDADGIPLRVPTRSRFEQPNQNADLLIRWQAREFNIQLPPTSFKMDIPTLPTCSE